MSYAAALVQLLLSGVFAFAGVSKLFDSGSTRKMMRDFGLPAFVANPFGTVLPFLELGLAVLLLGRWSWWGAVGALTLLLIFIVGIAANLVSGRKPNCNCFGQIRSAPVGWGTVARNLVLALGAAALVDVGPRRALGVVDGLSTSLDVQPHIATIWISILAIVAIQAVAIWQLFLQHGRLLLRVDQIASLAGDSAAKQGLPVGSSAPQFELPDATSGGRVSLASLLGPGLPVLLVFSDTDCQPCQKLLPQVGDWQRQYEARVRIAVISRGPDEVHRGVAKRHGIADFLTQSANEVAEAYRVLGTPAGIAVDAGGQISNEIALGRDEIQKLLAQVGGAPSGPFPGATRPLNVVPEVQSYGAVTR